MHIVRANSQIAFELVRGRDECPMQSPQLAAANEQVNIRGNEGSGYFELS